MAIKVLKLITGEDVLGDAETTQGEWYVTNPVAISIVRGKDGSPNVGLSPFPLHAPQTKDAKIAIPLTSVVYFYVPAEDFITNYNQVFGSGIVLPKTPQIIYG
jgi:hypothetical protein